MLGRFIAQPTRRFETRFASHSAQMFEDMQALPASPRRPIDVVVDGRRADETQWGHRYPRGRVYHVRVEIPGLGVSPGGRIECSNPACSASIGARRVPSDWPEAPADVVVAGEHHADVVLPDDRTREDLGDMVARVAIHGTTAPFHPNVGEPELMFCLARDPRPDWHLGTFLDQFVAMAVWCRAAVNDHDQRNPLAASYYDRLRRRWPDSLPTHTRSYYGESTWRLA